MSDTKKVPEIRLSDFAWAFCGHAHTPLSVPVSVDELRECAWQEISVPCDMIAHFQRCGALSDPYINRNDLLCEAVEELDWAFRCTFDVPADFAAPEADILLLVSELDCFGEIFLNAARLGSVENQFREHRFAVEDFLRESGNELIIYVRSSKLVNQELERVHGVLPAAFDTARVHARRCQCVTGWDWAARMSSTGILASPIIIKEPVFRLDSPFVWVRELTEVKPGDERTPSALLSVEVDIVAQRKGRGTVIAEIAGSEGDLAAQVETPVSLSAGRNEIRMQVRVANAALWWPAGMGRQPRYTVRFLFSGQDRLGESFSFRTEACFGIRTADILRKKEADWESFIPIINHVPVFCRGANWIPVRMLPSQISDQEVADLVASAAAAGMNCLRVWGGGIYERDLFYDLCDRMGILVWQDFMFACAAYPTYREILDEIDLEAEFQIRRLRNHPSILLWCGNNENEWGHQQGWLRKGEEKHIIGEQIWSTLLREKTEQFDPSRYYHQSSPFGRSREDFNDEKTGDRHNWRCWGGWQSPESYMNDSGRFLSEFGMQSFPAMESIRQFAPDAVDVNDWNLLHHQCAPLGLERLARYIAEMCLLPQTLEQWISTSQQLQCEVLRRGIEHWRRRKFATAGALVWQLHDAYPAISWALIDFYRRPKLAYRQARRFFSPVLLSIALERNGQETASFPPDVLEPNPEVPGIIAPEMQPARQVTGQHSLAVVLINDTSCSLTGNVELTLRTGDGEVVARLEQSLAAQPNSNSECWRISVAELGFTDVRTQFVQACFTADELSRRTLETCFAGIAEAIRQTIHETGLELKADLPDADMLDQALCAKALLVEPKHFRGTL